MYWRWSSLLLKWKPHHKHASGAERRTAVPSCQKSTQPNEIYNTCFASKLAQFSPTFSAEDTGATRGLSAVHFTVQLAGVIAVQNCTVAMWFLLAELLAGWFGVHQLCQIHFDTNFYSFVSKVTSCVWKWIFLVFKTKVLKKSLSVIRSWWRNMIDVAKLHKTRPKSWIVSVFTLMALPSGHSWSESQNLFTKASSEIPDSRCEKMYFWRWQTVQL